jgi:hypothetical protein
MLVVYHLKKGVLNVTKVTGCEQRSIATLIQILNHYNYQRDSEVKDGSVIGLETITGNQK